MAVTETGPPEDVGFTCVAGGWAGFVGGGAGVEGAFGLGPAFGNLHRLGALESYPKRNRIRHGAGASATPIRATHAVRVAAIVAAAQNAIARSLRPLRVRVGRLAVVIGRVAVHDPFPDAIRAGEDTPGVGLLGNLVVRVSRLVLRDRRFITPRVGLSFESAADRFFPLGFGGQPVPFSGLLAQPTAVRPRIVPTHARYGLGAYVRVLRRIGRVRVRRAERSKLGESHRPFADAECGEGHLMNRSLPGCSLGRAHLKRTSRDSNRLGRRLRRQGGGGDTNTRQHSDLIKHLQAKVYCGIRSLC